MRRRHFIFSLAALAAALPGGRAHSAVHVYRIGLTPVFLDNRISFLNTWRNYLQDRLRRPVQFLKRGTYREIVDGLRSGAIDFGWICGYPFVRYAKDLRLMAVPLYRGEPLYRSYLIVPASDGRTKSILDLRGEVFAFSDPDSNSGYLYPNYLLARLQERPGAFFRRTFFTWAHRAVVEAVAASLASGGAVDGYVWDTLATYYPRLTERTRVITHSPAFGFPPFVASTSVPRAAFDRMREVMLSMANDSHGKALLSELNLDGFVGGNDGLFEGIRDMVSEIKDRNVALPS